METLIDFLVGFWGLTKVFGFLALIFIGPMVAFCILFVVGAFVVAGIIDLVEWIRTPKEIWEDRKQSQMMLEAKRKKELEELLKVIALSSDAGSDTSSNSDFSSSSTVEDNPNNGGGPDEYGPSPGYGAGL